MDTSPHKSGFVNANGIKLHYLDWGGNGEALVFLGGMGCPAYIFNRLAPRFADRFHVLAMDRRAHGDSDYPETGYDPDTLTEDLRQFLDALHIERVILAGHSMGYIELTHFAALHPKRVIKLIYLDAAYNNSLPETKAAFAKNPIPQMTPPWPVDEPATIEQYIAAIKRIYPALGVLWDGAASEMMDEQTKYTVKVTPDGKVVDRMSDAIAKSIRDMFDNYAPEYLKIQAPTLSFFAIRDGADFLSSDFMTKEQMEQVKDFFAQTLQPHSDKLIEQFQLSVPHAKIVKIPNGHHYCFIKQEEIVYKEMMKFLLE